MSTAVAIQRSPELIAAEINNIKNQTRTMLLYNSIEIGRRLCEAKECIPHGEWGKWLEESVEYSQSTANNLMRIFDEYGSNQLALFGETGAKSQALGSLSYTQAVALLALPADQREEFISEHDVESMSSRELQKTIKELQQAKEDLEQEKKQNKNLLDIQEGLNEAKAKAETAKTEFEQKYIKMADTCAQLRKDLDNAKDSGDTKAQEELTQSLADALEKIKELEDQVKDKPIDVTATATITTIPDEVQAELDTLRASQRSAAELKFKLQFDVLVKDFNSLLTSLAEIEDENQDKYKTAVSSLITKMTEHL